MTKKIFIIVLFFLLTLNNLSFGFSGDTIKNPNIISFRAHHGIIITERANREKKLYPWAFEAEISRHLLGKKAWDFCYCYPRVGISFLYTNLDNPLVLGNAFCLVPFVEPFIGAHRKVNFSLKIGLGFVYLDKIYDEIANPDNEFFGSPYNFIQLINPCINYRISKYWHLGLGMYYYHISNSGFTQPNLGLEICTINLGIDHILNSENYSIKHRTIDLDKKKLRTELALLATGKAVVKAEEKYPVFGFSGKLSKVIFAINALSTSVEFVSDGAIKEEIKRKRLIKNGKKLDHKNFSLLAGHEFIFGRFRFSQQVGKYIYSPFKQKEKYFQRIGISFNITERIFVGINLKMHKKIGDYLDFRVGIDL
ncbi:MAG: acyloxyacyl hydrolase [Bacteroidales bacterium]|nr:acyloxyacyl hydrolase [Bacteroidales bacterium]